MSGGRPARRRPGDVEGGLPGGRLTRHAEAIGTGGPRADPAAAPADGEAVPDGELETFQIRLERGEPRVPLNVGVRWRYRQGARLLAARDGEKIQDIVEEALDLLFAAREFTPPSFWQRT